MSEAEAMKYIAERERMRRESGWENGDPLQEKGTLALIRELMEDLRKMRERRDALVNSGTSRS